MGSGRGGRGIIDTRVGRGIIWGMIILLSDMFIRKDVERPSLAGLPQVEKINSLACSEEAIHQDLLLHLLSFYCARYLPRRFS